MISDLIVRVAMNEILSQSDAEQLRTELYRIDAMGNKVTQWVSIYGSKLEGLTNPAERDVLTEPRTYYVRTDGKDYNDGLANTAERAFLTIANALNVVAALDCRNYKVTVQVGTGTWTANVILPTILGTAEPELVGDVTTPSNVHISGAGISAERSKWAVKGFKITRSGATGINVSNGGVIRISGNMEFGACRVHMWADQGGAIYSDSQSYTISGNADWHLMAQNFGIIYQYGCGVTVSSRTFVIFARCRNLGYIYGMDTTYTGTGNTGKRYYSENNAIIDTEGGGASHFPGDVAGTVSAGGLYL